VYDDGRLVASTPEPEWDQLEQGWMLALGELEAATCDGCGHYLDETLPPASEPEDWTLLPPMRCSVCTLLAMEQESYAKAETKHLHALRWRAIRKRKR